MRRVAVLATCTALVLTAGAGATRDAGPSVSTLLARHVPILVLHPLERFRPVSVDGFLADSDLLRRGPSGWEKIAGPLPAGGADLRLDQRLCSARDGVAAIDCYASAEDAHASPATVYGAAFRRGNRIALQYWLWYVLNPYSPTVPPGDLWQFHEGDWEAVTVLLDRSGRPLAAGYSQHSEGKRRDWAKVPRRGLHPLVYVALGSHANYFTPGTQPFDPRIVEPLLISIIRQNGYPPVDHTGNGRMVRPKLVRIAAKTPGWMTFAGTWGEDQYLHAPGQAPVVFGTSPRGPAFHELWKAPIADVLGWPRG